jgi:hypothetical protein
MSSTREIGEGKQYGFTPYISEGTGTAGPAGKSPARSELKPEEKAGGEEKIPEVKERAQKSSRLKKVEEGEEAPSEETPAEQKKETAKTQPRKEKTAKTEGQPSYKKTPTKDEQAKMFPGPSISSGLSNMGFTGMFIIPTTETINNNHALLSINNLSIHGSEGYAGTQIYTRTKSTGYNFVYGIIENGEISLTSRDSDTTTTVTTSSAFTTREQKLSTIGGKYRLGPTILPSKDNSDNKNNEDYAVYAAYARERVKNCVSSSCSNISTGQYLIYGLSVGAQVAENAKINGIYGKIKTTKKSFGDTQWGLGLEYQSSEAIKLYLEYLKESDLVKFKSLGLEYKYTSDLYFNTAYQIYTEEFADYDLNLKGYRIGANYLF